MARVRRTQYPEFFQGASDAGVRPIHKIAQPHISQIVKHKETEKIINKTRKSLNSDGWSCAEQLEYVTVDSGACDAIVPPRAFSNTPTAKHAEYGCTYKACGGEVVTNIGQKTVNCRFNEGFDQQVGSVESSSRWLSN